MSEEISKKVGYIRVRQNQFEIMVSTMEKNPFLNECKFSALYTAAKRSADWDELAKSLNFAGGAVKTVKVWQKCWTDKKSEVKRRYKSFKEAMKNPASERNDQVQLSPLENRILNLIGFDTAEDSYVEESEVTTEGHPKTNDYPTSPASTSGSISSFAILPVVTPLDLPETNEDFQLPRSPPKDTPIIVKTEVVTELDLPETNEDFQLQSSPPKDTPIIVKTEVVTELDLPEINEDFQLPSSPPKDTPIIEKNDKAQMTVEGQAEISSALNRCAEALEKRNEIEERRLEIENKKADAFIGILNLLRGNQT